MAFVLSRCTSWHRQRSSRAALSPCETMRDSVKCEQGKAGPAALCSVSGRAGE